MGVILNLAVWFAVHVLFGEVGTTRYGPLHLYVPDPATLDVGAALIAAGTFFVLFHPRWAMLGTLGLGVLAGLAWTLLTR